MSPETNPAGQTEQPPKAGDTESAAQPDSEASEVEIPSVGRILVRADADGYDEEVQNECRIQLCVTALLLPSRVTESTILRCLAVVHIETNIPNGNN